MSNSSNFANGRQFFIAAVSIAFMFSVLYTLSSSWERSENLLRSTENQPKTESPSNIQTPRRSLLHYNTKLSPPGVIYRMKGGIGNQFFEYACSYALAKQHNWTLYTYYIASSEPSRVFQTSKREFAIDYFLAPLTDMIDNTTSIEEIYANDEDLLKKDYMPDGHKFVRQTGYCQSMEYFKNYAEEIKQMFHPRLDSLNLTKLKSYVDRIKSTESIGIHVRRGDFVGITGFFIPISYQRMAIRKMVKLLDKRGNRNPPTFFVFSDDIAHTKKKLKDFENKYDFVYVTEAGNTSIEDFYLMMLCKHNIIPNSTFSWWAAYINENPDKIVIASAFNPEFWKLWADNEHWRKFYMKLHGTLYHPLDWIVIDPFSGDV